MRDAASGQWIKGHPPTLGGGRPPGSREGQAALCRVMDGFFLEMSESGDVEKMLHGIRKKGPKGVLAIMKLCGFEYWRKGLDRDVPAGQQMLTVQVVTR